MSKIREFLNSIQEALIDDFDKFAGKKVKVGRNNIKGYPVDIEDNPDGTYIHMTAVDKDACTGLLKELRKAGFKTKRSGNIGITIEK